MPFKSHESLLRACQWITFGWCTACAISLIVNTLPECVKKGLSVDSFWIVHDLCKLINRKATTIVCKGEILERSNYSADVQ